MGQVDRSLTSTDPPALRSEKQEARGLQPDGCTSSSKKHKHHSRKHSDDILSLPTRLEGAKRDFQSSTMKCSGLVDAGEVYQSCILYRVVLHSAGERLLTRRSTSNKVITRTKHSTNHKGTIKEKYPTNRGDP